MAVRVKTTKAEFNAAESGGYIYGSIIRQKSLPVYVDLGKEKQYIPSPTDDPMTGYKCFVNCNIRVAATEELLDQGVYLLENHGVTVIIYC